MNKKLCSGFGRYHTDNPESPKAKPFDTVTYIEIIVMAKKPPSVLKQHAQWFMPSIVMSRSKNYQIENGRFHCIGLDLDHNPPNIYKVAEIIQLICPGCDFLIYTSRRPQKVVRNPM